MNRILTNLTAGEMPTDYNRICENAENRKGGVYEKLLEIHCCTCDYT